MLPLISRKSVSLKSKAIAATLIAAMALPAPALAWGKNEQNFTKGVIAAIIAGAIIKDMNRQSHARPQPQPQPVYQPPVYQPPVYQPPVYHQPPVYQPPVYQPAPSLYSTAAAQAFNSYSRNERLRIQSTLANYGYYRGGIDGNFGPGTYQAVTTYAQSQGRLAELNTRGGAYGLYDGLIY